MRGVWNDLTRGFTADGMERALHGLVVFALGLVLARLARWTFRRFASKTLSPQKVLVGGGILYYSIFVLASLAALQVAGTDFGVLLGAAGILTVALGLASQTAASNLISGLFLVGEGMFAVGDLIRVGSTTGFVESIELLSIKIRTFDNVLARLPNETLLKTEIVNLSHFPIRRLDLTITVAYKEDLDRVHEVLLAVAERNPMCLEEPKPLFFVKDFDASGVAVRFSVWFTQETFWESKNRLRQQIKAAFAAAGIEIPFPHRTLYAGTVTEPFPVRVVGEPRSPV